MIDTDSLEINRIIIHRVHKKEGDAEYGIAEYSENLFSFGERELATLKRRITTAFSKTKRFFKLEIFKSDDNSFYHYSKKLKNCNSEEFLEISKNIADLLALSHSKKTIPAGLLLIVEGNINSKHFVLVIKAELQEAFTMKESNNQKLIELVNDLFLSPAKDFYKIGFIIEDRNQSRSPNDRHSCYMYDDNFSNGKKDLAEYFYNDFLGFTTSSNDKLITKNFKDDIFRFIESHVVSFDDKKGLKSALNTLYRENTTGVINPEDFAEDHFPENLLRLFTSEISSKYPHSFTKDLTLVERSLDRQIIKLVDDLKIEGPTDSMENVSISGASNFNIDNLRMQIENGEIQQIITIKTELL
ncbi:nucleoid-associated protein [Chryseobacterium sp. JJR-5R]|uniref:nucleoid-associated protein n=1 Tax=Chryseobacterium sp. JJR-5R TaxID=3093923 RepID=UPI002A75D30E|nr:nucleoid-associated protein [Chryseobacterium sp. JJR-5R]WPO84227.1 nucleoid-associated protein [Chryseobacterium sp. JJR-5R]